MKLSKEIENMFYAEVDGNAGDVTRGLQAVLDYLTGEGILPLTEDPPYGVKFKDCDGDVWVRSVKECRGYERNMHSTFENLLRDYGPLYVVKS